MLLVVHLAKVNYYIEEKQLMLSVRTISTGRIPFYIAAQHFCCLILSMGYEAERLQVHTWKTENPVTLSAILSADLLCCEKQGEVGQGARTSCIFLIPGHLATLPSSGQPLASHLQASKDNVSFSRWVRSWEECACHPHCCPPIFFFQM